MAQTAIMVLIKSVHFTMHLDIGLIFDTKSDLFKIGDV